MRDLLAARFQMGMSLAFHIVFAVVGIAMPVVIVVAERRWRCTGDPVYPAAGAAAIMAFAALWRRRYSIARLAAPAQVSLILWGWALSQLPYILPPDLTIGAAAAPNVTLHLVLGTVALGAVVLVPSLVYLFCVFKRSGQPSVVRHQ